MKKYKWSLYKTIEFLNNRRPDLEIRASFIRQLSYYEKRLLQETGVQSDAWTELASKPHLENDELILTHTFLNAQMGPFADFSKIGSTEDLNESSKLKWIDERESKKDLLVTNQSKDDLIHKDIVAKVTSHYDKKAEKPIIKAALENTPLNEKPESDEGEIIDQKAILETEVSDQHEKLIAEEVKKEPEEKHSKSVDTTKPHKAFEYKSKEVSAKKKREENEPREAWMAKPKHKASNSIDKVKGEKGSKSMNFKGKKLSDNSKKSAAKHSHTMSHGYGYNETSHRIRP